MRLLSELLLTLCVCNMIAYLGETRAKVPKMHKDNPNIRHVPRGAPPPHPGRLDKRPPPGPEPIHEPDGDTVTDDIAELNYEKYLREVTKILENDTNIQSKLANATREDIMSGKLAEALEFSSHSVRSQLDEAKRREVDRLRAEMRELNRMKKDESPVHEDYMKSLTSHLSKPSSPEDVSRFSKEDLQALIHKATKDLDMLDERRKREFKQHEMKKEIDRKKKWDAASPEERAQMKREFDAYQKKLKDHPNVHEPGHKQSLEDVWEETDHLERDAFEPKTFFKLHDINGDGLLDEKELEALYVKEVDKIYEKAENAHYDDEETNRLKEEELARMSEFVLKEVDRNRNRIIEFEEFMEHTKRQDFEKEEGWETVPEKSPYNDEDLKAYEKELEKEFAELERKKQKLKEFKAAQAAAAAGNAVKTEKKDVPKHESFVDIDGEHIPDFDAKLSDYYYGDYMEPDFE